LSSTPPNFSLILAESQWILPNGRPTQAFFRLIANLFSYTGGGSSPSPVTTTTIAYTADNTNAPDYDRSIADLATLIANIPDPFGRIADLERQVADIKAALYSVLPPEISVNQQISDLETIVFAAGSTP